MSEEYADLKILHIPWSKDSSLRIYMAKDLNSISVHINMYRRKKLKLLKKGFSKNYFLGVVGVRPENPKKKKKRVALAQFFIVYRFKISKPFILV